MMTEKRPLETAALSHHEHLKQLEWMVGHWVDEGDDSVTETTCEWSEDKNFLLRKFTISIDGKQAMKGVQRIGWDPPSRQIRSWVFDSAGGFAEGLWSRVGDYWVVKAGASGRTDGSPHRPISSAAVGQDVSQEHAGRESRVARLRRRSSPANPATASQSRSSSWTAASTCPSSR